MGLIDGFDRDRYLDAMDDYPSECDDFEDHYDPSEDCPTCRGTGRVTTDDYESYLGANYKPCPACAGDPCAGEPPLS